MVSQKDDPIWFSESRNCNRNVLYSEPIKIIHEVPVPNPVKALFI